MNTEQLNRQIVVFSSFVMCTFFLSPVTFGYLLSQIRLLSVCLAVVCLSVTFVHYTQPVEIFGRVSMPFVPPAIR